MKIQELIDRNEYPPMIEMLKRVNALVDAARECARVRANPSCGTSDVDASMRGVDEALFALEKAGDAGPTTTVVWPRGRRAIYGNPPIGIRD